MKKSNLIELTNKIYRITLLFPKKEPLRYKMREKADEILTNFISWEVLQGLNPGNFAADWKKQYKNSVFLFEKDIEVLKNYFEIAKWQNWVSFFDILKIQEKYDKMQSDFKEEVDDFKEETTVSRGPSSTGSVADKEKKLDSRKEKILNFLKGKDKVQVQDIKQVFSDVSKRTIRRDFVQLLEHGLVEKIGERNATFYRLKK